MSDQLTSISSLSGLELCHTLLGHTDIITRIAWSPDGRMIASTSKDGTLRLWNPETGELCRTVEANAGSIYNVAWSPNGKTLAIASHNGSMQLRNAETGILSQTIEKTPTSRGTTATQQKETLLICGIAFSPNGQTLALTGTSHDIGFFKLQQEQWIEAPETLEYPTNLGLLKQMRRRFQEEFRQLTGRERMKRERELELYLRHEIKAQRLFQESHREIERAQRQSQLRMRVTSVLQKLQRGIPLPSVHSFTNLIAQKPLHSIEWSPGGETLALIFNTDIELYSMGALLERQSLPVDSISLGIAWSPDGQTLSSACLDGTVQLWNIKTGARTRILEGHTDAVVSVAFSPNGHLLASKSLDDTVRLWRCDTWETIAAFHEPLSGQWFSSLAFHPHTPILATLGEKDTVIRLWKLDIAALLDAAYARPSVHYANAKVVLVGDSGVGKSGLGLVLSGQGFKPTDSTHGRRVWTFDRHTAVEEGGRVETHETLLWDLAGQPGYRLIHQLHLHEVAVALVVFDSRSEIDPFAGVRHWDRALRLAQRLQGNIAHLKKFLVAARADRGGIGVSSARIETLVRDLGFDGYFETSAREGWNIAELATALRQAVDWSALPRVSSTEFFQHIKDFLVAEKEAGRLLSTADDLYRAFLQSEKAPSETAELRAQFETCVGRVESRGLIRRLSFGDLILLQPELLDAYASALVNAAKDEPEGLGCIAEEDARIGRFRMPTDERIKDKKQESLLLIATIEEMLRHEIVLREQADDGPYLVFPSQFTREWSEAPDPEGKAVIFEFEGPVLNIYAMLAVRLSRSGFFARKAMWKNAAEYSACTGGTCGILLREVKEGSGELTLFYDQAASEEIRFQFEEYVRVHLHRRALSESIRQRRMLACPQCGFIVTEQLMRLLAAQNRNQLDCPVCKTLISLALQEVRITAGRAAKVQQMDAAADIERERETAVSILQGKIEIHDFDVFLCHNSTDKRSVKAIGKRLKERGISPWLDEWELRPGFSWQKALEEQITKGKSVAVFIGRHGIGPWQNNEIETFLREGARRACPIIPVILGNCRETPELPIFLGNFHMVDFRKKQPDPLQQLIWGITGEHGRF